MAATDSMTVRLLKRELLRQGLGGGSRRSSGVNGSSSSSNGDYRPTLSSIRIFEHRTELQVRRQEKVDWRWVGGDSWAVEVLVQFTQRTLIWCVVVSHSGVASSTGQKCRWVTAGKVDG